MGSIVFTVRMKTALLFITVLVALSECQNDPVPSVKLGNFQNTKHAVSGQVFKADDSTISIKNFNYDGTAPDAFFWVGTAGTPETVADKSTTKILKAGSKKSYEYDDTANSAQYILPFFDNEDITLTLPSTMTVEDLKRISVWCRQERQNFGTVYIGDNVIPDPEPEPETGKASSASGIMLAV